MSSVLPPPTLTEGNLVASAVLSCALDPADGRRLAFHLVNGCSGAGLTPCTSLLSAVQ